MFNFSAASAQEKLLDTRFSLKLTNTPINDVLFAIAKETDISFIFNSSLIPASEKMSISVTDKPLREVFKLIFDHYNIDFVEYDGNVIVKKQKGHTTIFKEEKTVIVIDDVSFEVVAKTEPIVEETDVSSIALTKWETEVAVETESTAEILETIDSVTAPIIEVDFTSFNIDEDKPDVLEAIVDTSTIADLDSSNLADNSVEATLPEETPKEKPFFSVEKHFKINGFLC